MWSRFLGDRRGAVAPMFALGLVPLIGFVGAAVDYSRGNAARTAMQAALDATALMLSRDAATMTPDQVSAKAISFFTAQFNRPETANVQVTAVLTSPQAGSFTLHVAASGNVPTTFTKLLGQDQLDISTSADVKWGIKKLEVALALDNTGSMAQNGKLTQLKTAAHNLLTTLQAAAKQPGDVKVAIIPFDTGVNVGTGYKDEFWIDYTVKNIQKSQWTGCVMDRDQSNDVLDTEPVSGSVHTLYPATTCGRLTSMMPLTDVLDQTGWTNLNSKVDAMQASGNTNVTIGLAWAWHALTPTLPLPEGSAPDPSKLDKVIILLTDGTNTQNRWSTSESSIDTRTALACANVKAASIQLYTVRVIDGNTTLLRNCATKPGMYYDVQQASQLNGVFTSIAQTLANLRIAR
jgi:Flp pilus assembly protein TadG